MTGQPGRPSDLKERILALLDRKGELAINDIATLTGEKRNTVYWSVRQMRYGGLIEISEIVERAYILRRAA